MNNKRNAKIASYIALLFSGCSLACIYFFIWEGFTDTIIKCFFSSMLGLIVSIGIHNYYHFKTL